MQRAKREFADREGERRKLPIPKELVDDDVIAQVVREEARPIVREALNERVMEALHDLVHLTPQLVQNLANDLQDPDPVVRQKSQAVVARYTLGMAAKDDDAGKDKALEVNINVPRAAPDAVPVAPEASAAVLPSAEDVATRVCEDCQRELHVEEFEGEAPRCMQCVARIRQQTLDRFEGHGFG